MQPHDILEAEIKLYTERLDRVRRNSRDPTAMIAYAQVLLALKRVARLMRQDAAKAEAGGVRHG